MCAELNVAFRAKLADKKHPGLPAFLLKWNVSAVAARHKYKRLCKEIAKDPAKVAGRGHVLQPSQVQYIKLAQHLMASRIWPIHHPGSDDAAALSEKQELAPAPENDLSDSVTVAEVNDCVSDVEALVRSSSEGARFACLNSNLTYCIRRWTCSMVFNNGVL